VYNIITHCNIIMLFKNIKSYTLYTCSVMSNQKMNEIFVKICDMQVSYNLSKHIMSFKSFIFNIMSFKI